MTINIKQLQELIFATMGIKINIDFEGCFILNYDGLYMYRCNEFLILLRNEDGSSVEIHLDEEKHVVFKTKHELLLFLSLIMEKHADNIYYSFLDNVYYLHCINKEECIYLLISETLIVKCLMEVEQ